MSDSVIFCQSIYACPLHCFLCKVQLIQGAKKFRSNQAEIPKWGGRMGGSAKWEKFPHNPIIVHSSVTAHWLWQRGRCSEMLGNLEILTTKSRLDLTWLFKSFPWPERPGCNNFLSSVPCQTQPVTNLPSKWQIDMTIEQKPRHSLSKLGHPRGIGHLLVSTTGNLITTIIVIVVTFQEADLHHKHHEHHQHNHQESRPSPWTRRTKVSNNGRWESSISTLS